MRYIIALILVIIFIVPAIALPENSPDISLIGAFEFYSNNNSQEIAHKNKVNFADPQVELVISGNVNKYITAKSVIAWHDEESAEVEEFYADINNGLPYGISIRIGRNLLNFGRLNPVHLHVYPFVVRPLVHESFWGNEGLVDMSISPTFDLSKGNYQSLFQLAIFKGKALMGHDHEESHEITEESSIDPGYLARITSSKEIRNNAIIALGFSVLNATSEVLHTEPETPNLRSTLIGADLKYRSGSYHDNIFQCEGEIIARIDDHNQLDHLYSWGAYGYANKQFQGKFNFGGILEYLNSQTATSGTGGLSKEETKSWRVGLFAGYSPIEESSLVRIATRWIESDTDYSGWEINLQFVFNLGHHQHHNF